MIIMGVDPGVARVGWSIVTPQKYTMQPLAYGCIETAQEQAAPFRLETIYNAVLQCIQQYKPDCMAVEDVFFATNAKTAISVGQSRGVILLAASVSRIPVISYSPLAVKRAITGDGKADKTQVSRMVQLTLKLSVMPKLDDTTDALAIAMTHAYSYKIKQHV